MQEETDMVLSAIRRGVDSRPGLHRETGIDYSRLDIVLHRLQFEWLAINKTETADGFDRFSARAGEKLGYIDVSVTDADKRSAAKRGMSLEPGRNGHSDTPKPVMSESITPKVSREAVKQSQIEAELRDEAAATEICGCGRPRPHGGRCWYVRKMAGEPFTEPGKSKTARTSAETVAKVQEMLGAAPDAVKEAILEADAAVMFEIAPEFERDAFCLQSCDPPTVGHHYQCGFYKKENGVGNSALALASPAGDKLDVRFPPSALLKKLVCDDDFFPGAYDTLIAILDDDMNEDEKQAVWTLLRYLKNIEKSHLEACIAAEAAP